MFTKIQSMESDMIIGDKMDEGRILNLDKQEDLAIAEAHLNFAKVCENFNDISQFLVIYRVTDKDINDLLAFTAVNSMDEMKEFCKIPKHRSLGIYLRDLWKELERCGIRPHVKQTGKWEKWLNEGRMQEKELLYGEKKKKKEYVEV
jgi:hypothetical protein